MLIQNIKVMCFSPVGSAFLESKPTEKILQQKGSSWPTPDHGKDAPREGAGQQHQSRHPPTELMAEIWRKLTS